tara:strand:- start:183 stop:632 length:450 start_codon:yes stop_codon:yes gene_type:complete
MPVTFTSNFKNILDKLRNILRTEFKNALPVYIGHESTQASSQFMRLDPIGSELITYMASAEQREYTVNMYYYFLDKNIKKTSLDHVLRYTSRIEALMHDNSSASYTNENSATEKWYNGRVESTSLNALEDENEYVVELVWKCQHTGNVS